MTVRELIELNQMITDAEITVRKDGKLLDQLNIGSAQGIKPPYPIQVPTEEKYIDNMSYSTKRDAHYINKSINTWDDGKDYWQVKPDRIPKKWLDLEIYAWEAWPASTAIYGRRRNYDANFKNVNFHGERINITALPSGESLAVQEPVQKVKEEQIEGQMDIEDFLGGNT